MSKIKVLAVDIGHNVPYDGGAVGIRKEDELNKIVGERLLERLKETNLKIINCTPSTSTSLSDSLKKRCDAANSNKGDLFISIHHNATPGGYGCEALCITGGIAEEVSKNILKEIEKLGYRNRGVKPRRDLYVIRNTVMPAIIIECAFVDNAKDMANYNGNKMGDAIFNGLCRALDLRSSETFHIVSPGETLWGISRIYKTTVDEIVRINGIKDRNLIRVGQKLKIS